MKSSIRTRMGRVLILLLFSFTLCAQGINVLTFDGSKGGFLTNDPIPYGERIILRGQSASGSGTVTIKMLYGLKEETVTVEVNGGRWETVVGPFPFKTNIIFVIEERVKIPAEEIVRFNQDFQTGLLKARADFFQQGRAMDIAAFKTMILGRAKDFLEDRGWSRFKTGTGEPLIEAVASRIDSFDLLNLLQKVSAVGKMPRSDFYTLAMEKSSFANKLIGANQVSDICAPGNIEIIKGELKASDPNLPESVLGVITAEIQGICREIDEGTAALGQLISDLTVFFHQSVVATSNTRAETLGLQSYLGIDLGVTYITRVASTPFFVTLSPYFKKIEPDRDYSIRRDGIWYFLTPTLGFGLGNQAERLKPVYFAGVGCRLNKMVRFAIGGAYHQPIDSLKYQWNWGFNASISINYVSDLFKLISSAQSGTN